MRSMNIVIVSVSLATTLASFATGAADFTVAQNNKAFALNGTKIDKIAIKVGDTVFFKNEDPFFHNIFSLSDIKTFDLGSYAQGQAKSVTFDKPGQVDIECAIHPSMMLKLDVK